MVPWDLKRAPGRHAEPLGEVSPSPPQSAAAAAADLIDMVTVDDLDLDDAASSLYPSSPELQAELLLREGTLDDDVVEDGEVVAEVTTPVIDLYEAGGSLGTEAVTFAGGSCDLLQLLRQESFSPFSRFVGGRPRFVSDVGLFDYRRRGSDELTLRGAESDGTYPSIEEPTFPLTGDIFASPRAESLNKDDFFPNSRVSPSTSYLRSSPLVEPRVQPSRASSSLAAAAATSGLIASSPAARRNSFDRYCQQDPWALIEEMSGQAYHDLYQRNSPKEMNMSNHHGDFVGNGYGPSTGFEDVGIAPEFYQSHESRNGFADREQGRYYGEESKDMMDYDRLMEEQGFVHEQGHEKQSFLSGQPDHDLDDQVRGHHGQVQLTPSWEERNVSEDHLNFRAFSNSMDRLDMEINPPRDRTRPLIDR